MSEWKTLFRDAVPGVAGVVVYDKGTSDALGRYVVAKTMRLPSGKMRSTQCDYIQRPAALRYAKKFLFNRAAKVGKMFTPGEGKNFTEGYFEKGGAS
jgi:hypothetical protein